MSFVAEKSRCVSMFLIVNSARLQEQHFCVMKVFSVWYIQDMAAIVTAAESIVKSKKLKKLFEVCFKISLFL